MEADVDAVTDSPENVGHERSVRVVAEGVLPSRQVQGGLHWAEVGVLAAEGRAWGARRERGR